MSELTPEVKARIAIKNVSFNERLSEETHCFSATVYLDGKRLCIASNRGHGGCTDFDPVQGKSYEDIKAVEEWLKGLEPMPVADDAPEWEKELYADGYKPDLEAVIAELVNDWLYQKDAKRIQKKLTVVCIHEGKPAMMSYKISGTTENVAKYRSELEAKGEIVVNGLPIEEVVLAIRDVSAFYEKHKK